MLTLVFVEVCKARPDNDLDASNNLAAEAQEAAGIEARLIADDADKIVHVPLTLQ